MMAAKKATAVHPSERDAWSRGQRCKNDLLYVLARALFVVLPWVPRRTLARFGEAVGWLAMHVFPGARRLADHNLAAVFPTTAAAEREELRRRNFRLLGRWLGEALAVATGRPGKVLPFAGDGAATLRAAIAEGRGVLVVSAHLGPWEQLGASLVAHEIPLLTLTRGAYDSRLDFVYRRLRGASGVAFVARGSDAAAMRVVRALKGGGILGAPMDLASRARSVDALFLGIPALTVVGPARLALASGAAVVAVTVGPAAPAAPGSRLLARPRSVALALHVDRVDTSLPFPAPTATDAPSSSGSAGGGARVARAALLTQRLNDVLEARIRAFPEGWVWMHDRFGVVPPFRSRQVRSTIAEPPHAWPLPSTARTTPPSP